MVFFHALSDYVLYFFMVKWKVANIFEAIVGVHVADKHIYIGQELCCYFSYFPQTAGMVSRQRAQEHIPSKSVLTEHSIQSYLIDYQGSTLSWLYQAVQRKALICD